MPFYIRKAFKTGPVRLNLSKGGLGLSAGVTGARVGINSRGTYVHGGRHGLYYRKYHYGSSRARSGRSGSSGSGRGSDRAGSRSAGDVDPAASQSGRAADGRTIGSVDLFRDTGTTFLSRAVELESLSMNPPDLPSLKIWNSELRQTVIAVMILFAIAVIWGEGAFFAPALLLAVAAVAWVVHNLRWRSKATSLSDRMLESIEDNEGFPAEEMDREMLAKMPGRWREWLTLNVQAVAGEMAMRREELDTVETLRGLDQALPGERKTIQKLRAALVGQILDEMLEDHLLSGDEETAVRNLIEELGLPDDLVAAELKRLEHYARIRRVMEEPLEPIDDPGVPLVRGEKAFAVFEPARLLNERVLDRFQREKVQYRELGYEIDLEGKLILTDRRLLMVGRGSREYRLNKVLDVTTDPQAGTVELTLSGRKSPVILTVEEPLTIAATIEKVIEEEVMEG